LIGRSFRWACCFDKRTTFVRNPSGLFDHLASNGLSKEIAAQKAPHGSYLTKALGYGLITRS